jgi:hypothetical protein
LKIKHPSGIYRFLFLFLIIILFQTEIKSQQVNNDTVLNSKLNNLPKKEQCVAIDYFLVPAFLFNSVNLGVSFMASKRLEYAFLIGSRVILYFATFNVNANFNINYYLNKSNFYIPLWLKFSDMRTEFLFSDQFIPTQSLKICLGTGIGSKSLLLNKLHFRTELGLGAGIAFTREGGYALPYDLDYSQYGLNSFTLCFKFKVTMSSTIYKKTHL